MSDMVLEVDNIDNAKIQQDITLKVSESLAYSDIFDFLLKEIDQTKPDKTLTQLYPLDIYQDQLDKAHKNLSFRLQISCHDRTLMTGEVNALLEKVADQAKQKFDADVFLGLSAGNILTP